MYNLLKLSSCLASTLLLGLVAFPALEGGRSPISQEQWGEPVQAATPKPIQWSPERGRGSAGGTLSGGRRGTDSQCAVGDVAAQMTLLVPDDAAGLLTTVANPALYWHVETARPVSMTFVLQDVTAAQPVYTQVVTAKQSGITGVQLPTHVALQVGAKYRWGVFLACGEQETSEMYARSFIQRVEAVAVRSQAQGQSPVTQAAVYAQAGIWYDAVSPLVQAVKTDPSNEQAKVGLKSLLAQAKKSLPL